MLRAVPVKSLDIDDEPGPDSLRGVIERNAIALLSNHGRTPLDPPSPGWLGYGSDRPLVRGSGLWNQRHVEETHDPAFLGTLEMLVERYCLVVYAPGSRLSVETLPQLAR